MAMSALRAARPASSPVEAASSARWPSAPAGCSPDASSASENSHSVRAGLGPWMSASLKHNAVSGLMIDATSSTSRSSASIRANSGRFSGETRSEISASLPSAAVNSTITASPPKLLWYSTLSMATCDDGFK